MNIQKLNLKTQGQPINYPIDRLSGGKGGCMQCILIIQPIKASLN